MSNKKVTESEMFQTAFGDQSAGCRRDCACGRVHFDGSDSNGWTWDEGELENLRARREQKPEEYFEWDYAVRAMIIDGNYFVMDCPCGYAVKAEKFILQNAEAIKRYLVAWSKEMMAKAEAINPTV